MEHPLRSPFNAVFYIRLIPSGFTRERSAKAAAAASQLPQPVVASCCLSWTEISNSPCVELKFCRSTERKLLCVVIAVPLYDRRREEHVSLGALRGDTDTRKRDKHVSPKRFLNDNAGGLSFRVHGYAARRIFGAPSRQAATVRANLPTLFLMGDIYRETLGAVAAPTVRSPVPLPVSPFALPFLSLPPCLWRRHTF